MKVQVEWTLRSGNQEADELANGIVDRSSPELRVDVEAEDLGWHWDERQKRSTGKRSRRVC